MIFKAYSFCKENDQMLKCESLCTCETATPQKQEPASSQLIAPEGV